MTDYSDLFIKAKKATIPKLNFDQVVDLMFKKFMQKVEKEVLFTHNTTETCAFIPLYFYFVAEDSVDICLAKHKVLEKIRETLPTFVNITPIGTLVRLDWPNAPDQ